MCELLSRLWTGADAANRRRAPLLKSKKYLLQVIECFDPQRLIEPVGCSSVFALVLRHALPPSAFPRRGRVICLGASVVNGALMQRPWLP